MISFSNIYGAISEFRALYIYNKLKPVNAPNVVFNMNLKEPPNAFYNKQKNIIIVNKTLLNIADDNTIATTFGHELTHFKYKDGSLIRSDIGERMEEIRADIEGKILTTKAGYDVCKGFKWILKGNTRNAFGYPDSDVRWNYLGCNKKKHKNK